MRNLNIIILISKRVMFPNWIRILPPAITINQSGWKESEIDAGDHPFYKRVYLRQMAIEGGEPKVIVYIYGRHGTINAPSCLPDGKKIAFVTNSILLD